MSIREAPRVRAPGEAPRCGVIAWRLLVLFKFWKAEYGAQRCLKNGLCSYRKLIASIHRRCVREQPCAGLRTYPDPSFSVNSRIKTNDKTVAKSAPKMRDMKILIIGASGFVGRALVERLIGGQCFRPLSGAQLVLFGINSSTNVDASRCRLITGRLIDKACCWSVFGEPVDIAFYLVSLCFSVSRGRALRN